MFGQGVIPDDWEGEYCCYAVEWPNSPQWLAVLRGVLTMPGQGRFWDKHTGVITEAQEVIRQTFDNNLHFTEVIMACGDTGISEALRAIAVALSANSNCCGSEVSNCYNYQNVDVQAYVTLQDGTNWPIYGTGPIPTLPETGFPEGYDDLESYEADKCSKATKIVDDWTATIKNFGAVNWGIGVIGAAVIVACIVGLITVPPAVIPLLLFALTANEGMAAIFIALGNWMEANREDLICILYQEDNIETMISLLSDALDVGIASIPVEGGLALIVRGVALWLVNSDTLGVLLTAGSKGLYPEADCSECGAPEIWVIDGATGAWKDSGFRLGEPFEYAAEQYTDGFYYLEFKIGEAGVPAPEEWEIVVTAINTSNEGSCTLQGLVPGTYPAIEFTPGGTIGFFFGCTDSFQPTISATIQQV